MMKIFESYASQNANIHLQRFQHELIHDVCHISEKYCQRRRRAILTMGRSSQRIRPIWLPMMQCLHLGAQWTLSTWGQRQYKQPQIHLK